MKTIEELKERYSPSLIYQYPMLIDSEVRADIHALIRALEIACTYIESGPKIFSPDFILEEAIKELSNENY